MRNITVLLFILLFLIIGCNRKEKNHLTFKYDKKTIKMNILNDKNELFFDDATTVEFVVKNISLENIRIVAPGISIRTINDTLLQGNILIKKEFLTVFPEYFDNDHLNINIAILKGNRILKKDIISVPIN